MFYLLMHTPDGSKNVIHVQSRDTDTSVTTAASVFAST
jgi:hypothetical protein